MTIDVPKASDIELINLVDRIPKDNALENDIVKKLMRDREEALIELKKRTGFDGKRLNQYIQSKLREQQEMRENKWEVLSKEGAVFTYKQRPHIFETVRRYLPPVEMVANELILTRVRGTSQFTYFNDTNTPELVIQEDAKPLYVNCTPEQRGLIKAYEHQEQREKGEPVQNLEDWGKFDELGNVVFYHKGFDETFEVLKKYGLPDRERTIENEVLLTKSHKRPVFVEFTPFDTLLMEITPNTSPRFNVGNSYDLKK